MYRIGPTNMAANDLRATDAQSRLFWDQQVRVRETTFGCIKGLSAVTVKDYLWLQVHCMFLVLVPWGSIATLNAWIIVTLMKNTKGFKELYDDEQKLTERQKQDGQITKVLLTVTFAFLILLAWQCVNQCFFMLHYTKGTTLDPCFSFLVCITLSWWLKLFLDNESILLDSDNFKENLQLHKYRFEGLWRKISFGLCVHYFL